MRRPSFQFYPADWRNDTGLRLCSLAARGLWVEMMCIAHECEPYGYLRANGNPMTAAQIGRLTGISERECSKLLDELFDAGVPSQTVDGTIYSRRMVRDEQLRLVRAEGGKSGAAHGVKGGIYGANGGRPRKETTPQETPLGNEARGVIDPPLKPPPSSSSSTSSKSVSLARAISDSTGVAREDETRLAPESADLSPVARVCLGLKAMGYSDTNPHDAKLFALLEAGLTPDEILAAGHGGKGNGKGFRWVLAAAEGRRREAAKVTPLPAKAAAGTLSKAGQNTAAAVARWLESEGVKA